jgi:hypothetical protein
LLFSFVSTRTHQLLHTSWDACLAHDDGVNYGKDDGGEWQTDVVIANPPAFAGYHIAEKLKVPFHSIFTMPWSRTESFKHPFMLGPGTKCAPVTEGRRASLGSETQNYMSWGTVERYIWAGIGDIVNHFRTCTLHIPACPMDLKSHKLTHLNHVPTTYCYSPHLLEKPVDWGSHVDVTGFCFLDTKAKTVAAGATVVPDKAWMTPELAAFVSPDAGPAPIFVGFGSIVVRDPQKLIACILEGVLLTEQRVIIQQGWSGIKDDIPFELMNRVLFIGRAPHDQLFEHVKAVVHHGGAGTMAAGARLGKPTVIVPFFGDQFFWASTISRLGAGTSVPHASLTPKSLAAAINFVLSPPAVESAQELGRHIRAENGIARAVESFHNHLPVQSMQCSTPQCNGLAKHCCHSCAKLVCSACMNQIREEVMLVGNSTPTGQNLSLMGLASPYPGATCCSPSVTRPTHDFKDYHYMEWSSRVSVTAGGKKNSLFPCAAETVAGVATTERT